MEESRYHDWGVHAYDQAPVGLCCFDTDFRYVHINERLARINGLPKEEHLGRTVRELMPDLADGIENQLREVIETGEPLEGGTVEAETLAHLGKKRVYEYNLFPLRDEQGVVKGVSCAVQDVTTRVRAEVAESRLQHIEEAHKDRLETVGTLAAGIAHDFNNLLSPILGFTRLIRDDIVPKGERDRLFGLVLDAGERAKNLVEQIFALTGRRKIERTPLDLMALVGDACEFLRATLPATVEIRDATKGPVSPIHGDWGQIFQVLTNLSINAAHAMRATGGSIEISVLTTELDQDFLERYPDYPEKRAVRVSVRDTGEGMDDETLARIFEPFFSTKQIGEGTGLGLSIVQGIMDDHQGVVEVRSVLGQGTTFDLYFPVSTHVTQAPEELADQTTPARVGGHAPVGGHERVLVVDDAEAIVALQVELLESLGYSCWATTSSAEALKEVKRRPDGFDVVLTDLTMPGMTGVELAEELADLAPSLPIIVMTGYRPEGFDLLKGSIRAVLAKPFTLEDLDTTIRQVVNGTPEVQATGAPLEGRKGA